MSINACRILQKQCIFEEFDTNTALKVKRTRNLALHPLDLEGILVNQVKKLVQQQQHIQGNLTTIL